MKIDFSIFRKGVTVIEDSSSPTGYSAVFIYEEQEHYEGLSSEIVKVELYSDCMMLFDPDKGTPGTISSADAISPYDFRPGLSPAGGNPETSFVQKLVKIGDRLWATSVPLSSGAFVYNFRVTDSEGNIKARLDDPANPAIRNSATGIRSLSSMVYVPYDSERMGSGSLADRSLELPLPDSSLKGTLDTVSYTGADKKEHGLAVYLPHGYDRARTEPYKVLYLSHGTSGDVYGNELRWMNEGTVMNIMDNLIAQGAIEPFIVVTMNNQQYSRGEDHQGPDWRYRDIEIDQIEYIMPYVEAHYNVSASPEGRAYAGLSMGGATTSNMLMYHPELFSWYGIWSYANIDGTPGDVEGLRCEAVQQRLAALPVKPRIMLAAGKWDFGLSAVKSFGELLSELGFQTSYLEVPAGHDWECWQLIYAHAVASFLFR